MTRMTVKEYVSYQKSCEGCPHRVGTMCYAQEVDKSVRPWININDAPRRIEDISTRPEWCPGFNMREDFVHPCPSEQCRRCEGWWPMSGDSNGGPGRMGGSRTKSCGLHYIYPTEETGRSCPHFTDAHDRRTSETAPDCKGRFEICPEVVDILIAGINDRDLTFWRFDSCTYCLGSIGSREGCLGFWVDMHPTGGKLNLHLKNNSLRNISIPGIVSARTDGRVVTLECAEGDHGPSIRIPIAGKKHSKDDDEEESESVQETRAITLEMWL
jgi:hypothetical protein